MRDAVHGIRPTDASLVAHANALIAQGHRQRALVSIVSSSALHTKYPTSTLVALLEGLNRAPPDPPSADAVRKVLDLVLFAPQGLTSAQLDVVVTAASRFGFADFVLRVAEHACSRGCPLTKRSVLAVVSALSSRASGKSEEHVRLWYSGAVALLQAAALPLDADLAIALIRLLCGSRSAAFHDAREHDAVTSEDAAGPRSPLRNGRRHHRTLHDTDARDPSLEAAFALVAGLPDAELASGKVTAELLLACLRRGRRDRAIAAFSEMQRTRRSSSPPSAAVFNALITSDAPLGRHGGVQAASLHLALMRDAGGVPDSSTLLALVKAYLYASEGGSGAAHAISQLSASLGVPITQRVLGTAAFYAAKSGNFEEVEAVIRLLRGDAGQVSSHRSPVSDSSSSTFDSPGWLRGAGGDAAAAAVEPPRWLRKLSSIVAALATQPPLVPPRQDLR